MEVTISANIADMVTMSSNLQSRVGNVSSVVNSGIDSGASRNTNGLTMVECQNNNNCVQNRLPSNNNNGETSAWQNVPQDPSKMNKLREMVESSASVASKCMVDTLLQQVNQLSDLDKFLLYLKLPVGRSPDLDPLKQPLNPLGSRSEIQLTITWMKTHLEIDLEVSLPKEEVYNEYMHYCTSNGFKALSTADFGKVMKQVFPSVRARRLGHRGASKYCHSGLRKKFVLDVPTLPDLTADTSSSTSSYGTNKNEINSEYSLDEVDKATSSIIFEWAEKMCNMKVDNYKELALLLIDKNFVDHRSVAAYTLLSLDQRTGGGKHRETQYQLQKKLQEREHIREQKRKLQEQQPGVTKSCPERPKTRRRSGSIRNPPVETSGNNTVMNSYTNANKSNGGSSSISDPKPNNCSNSRYEVETNNNKVSPEMVDSKLNIKSSSNVCPSTIIKQEETSNISQYKSIFADKKEFGSCSVNNMNINIGSNVGVNSSNQKLMRAISLDSNVGMSNTTKTPSPKTYFVMSNVASNSSHDNNGNSNVGLCNKLNRYIAIQPKGTSNESMANLNNNGTDKGINNFNTLQQWNEASSNLGHLEVNSECLLSNVGHTNETDDLQKRSQISELRKLLEKNLNSSSVASCMNMPRSLSEDGSHADIDHEMATTCIKRRVSFQQSVDSNDNLNKSSSLGCASVNHIPPSPTIGTKAFNFTPINNSICLNVSQGPSQTSSANASPFVSPRSTPLHRSRHNSGQTSSTYVTPRSTPYTPEISYQSNVHSENSSPFMSPAATPLQSRTRHNSSQNYRPSTTTCRPRHHSGNPSFRRTPYAEDACNRRTKCRSRHDSGSIPPSPHSAPLSPLMHESTVHPSGEPNLFHSHLQQPGSSNSNLQNVLMKQQQQQSTYIGCDLRRRHMSAGHYTPQNMPVSYSLNHSIGVAYNNDHLGQEVSNVMNSSQPGPSSITDSSNRAQSVPLLQMLNSPCGSDADGAKSHPSTPLVSNTPFWYSVPTSDCFVSDPSSYTPTPVPSEYDDFVDYSNLGANNELGMEPGSEDSGVTSLEDIYSMNLQPHSDFDSVIESSIRSDDVPSAMQSLMTSSTAYSIISEKTTKDESVFSVCNLPNSKNGNSQNAQSSITYSDSSLLTLNAINNTLSSVLESNSNTEGAYDPAPSEEFHNNYSFIEDNTEFNPSSQEFLISHDLLSP